MPVGGAKKRPAAEMTVDEQDGDGAEAPMGVTASNAVNYKLKKLEAQGRPFPRAHFKSLSAAGKRDMLRKLELDPDASFLEAEESNWNATRERQTDLSGWCYLWDVARINGLSFDQSNEQQMSLIKSLVHGCEEQEADSEHLRTLGHKMYWYEKSMEGKTDRDKGKKIDARATAACSKQDYKDIVKTLRDGNGGPASTASNSLRKANVGGGEKQAEQRPQAAVVPGRRAAHEKVGQAP